MFRNRVSKEKARCATGLVVWSRMLFRTQGQWLVEPEVQGSLGGHVNGVTTREDLGTRPGPSTGDRSDGCTFAAASDGADESPKNCAAAHVLRTPSQRPYPAAVAGPYVAR